MIKISKKDIVWNYAGGIFGLGINFLLLPFILKMLNRNEIGLWYAFTSIGAMVSLFDFGFAPAIKRNITYVWNGAKNLIFEGVPDIEDKKEVKPNYNLLRSLIFTSKRIYLIISVIAITILLSIGTIYIISISPKEEYYIYPWIIYSIAIFFNLYFSYWTPMLKGIGEIKRANQSLLISSLLYLILSIIGLLMGLGLLALSISYFIQGILFRIISKYFFIKKVNININNKYKDDVDNDFSFKNIFKAIWPNASKQGLVTFGAWLIQKSTTLLCSFFLGLEITAQFGVSLQIYSFVFSGSALLFSSYIPEITSTKINNDQNRYKHIFSRAIFLQWFVGVIGIFAIIMFGPYILNTIGSNSRLLPNHILLILGIILFLECNHSTFASLITLSNKVPFVRAAILSGVGIITLSLIVLKFTKLGILGLVLSQGIIQLLYNNWRWPFWVMKEDKITIFKILNYVFNDFFVLIFRKK